MLAVTFRGYPNPIVGKIIGNIDSIVMNGKYLDSVTGFKDGTHWVVREAKIIEGDDDCDHIGDDEHDNVEVIDVPF